MRPLEFQLCDVFTDRPLAGNALAVFTDARELSEGTMQALAREMNLSESAFVLPPTSATEADARLRIFTPTMELPFAGHPTLGTAFVLASAKWPLAAIRLETARGIVPVRLTRAAAHDGPGFGWMSQPIPARRAFSSVEQLLAALGVQNSRLPIELYDNGPHYVLLELATPAEIAELRPDLARLAAFGSLAFLVCARHGARWKVRVFAPGEGITEDPATGAAAGPLALHLARHGRVNFGDEIVIEQGAEVGRPSTLFARALGSVDRIERIEVGGNAVVVARGEFNRSLLT